MSNNMNEILVCCYRPWDISSNKKNSTMNENSRAVSFNTSDIATYYDNMNLEMSGGEVKQACSFSRSNFAKDGLFSNVIFGFDHKWKCNNCKNIEVPFQICQKCEHDIFCIYSDNDRYGHISLTEEVFVTSKGYVNTIFVFPTQFRSGKFSITKSELRSELNLCDINRHYKKIITRNNRLGRLLFLKAPEVILVNERRMLTEIVESFFNTIDALSQ